MADEKEAPSQGAVAFSRPPVAEVVIAVEFLPIPALDLLKLISLHDVWHHEFPTIQIQPAILAPLIEGISFPSMAGLPPMRLWSLDGTGNVLLQVQADRLIVNWRRPAGDSGEYPSYRSLISTWERAWSRFQAYLKTVDASPPEVSVVEVSYVNSIPVASFEEAISGFKLFAGLVSGPVVESVAMRSVYRVPAPDFDGQVVVQAEYPTGEKSQLALSIVTRLAGGWPSSDAAIRARLDAAHEASVSTFLDLTSDEMHRIWGAL